MSEDICSECGVKGGHSYTCSKAPQKIKVTVERSAEVDSLQQELANTKRLLLEKQKISEDFAVAFFTNAQEELAKKYPSDANLIEACSTPQALEDLKRTLEKKNPLKTPMGKSSMTPLKGSEQDFETQTQLIDAIYDKILHPHKYDREEVEEAKRQRDKLIEAMISGKSWKQLKERGTSIIEQHKLSACPLCQYTLVDTSKCPNCGYDPTEKQKILKTRKGSIET
jgi:hypothetical protein